MGKITKLQAENFKRIKAVTIEPSGAAVIIGGKNAQGKSSALDAIESVLGGLRRSPPEPVRRGARGAKVVLSTDDFTATREWSRSSSRLRVEAKDGSKISSPQKLFDSMVGALSFDPLAFSRLDRREQARVLRELVGLDFSAELAEIERLRAERRDTGRDVKRLRGAVDSLPLIDDDAPDDEVSISDLMAELDAARAVNAKNAELRRSHKAAVDEVAIIKDDLAEAVARVADIKAELANAERDAEKSEAATVGLADVDTDEIQQRIRSNESINAKVRAKRKLAEFTTELAETESLQAQQTSRIAALEGKISEDIASAKYPIGGLSVSDDGVMFDGIPFEQASQAQQLRVSVAIGFALNPDLKVLLIRDGSVLDSDGLRLLTELAEREGGQVWIERVSETGEGCTVVIEDGSVAEGVE